MFLFFSIEHCTEINKNIDCQWPISEIRDFNRLINNFNKGIIVVVKKT